jgi:asparagine synthase (glutamine-hydrolysing)
MFGRAGAPIDRGLLQALAQFLSFRGPDARETWSSGSVGFGHTMLRTTRESIHERQPGSLDGQFWITADARIDFRPELQERLENAGRKLERPATDSGFILQAYAVWGEECVHYLRGDFAFAIWDARRKTLFCARDHFGIKPFYYAELGDLFLFSNTLDCLRLHPEVSGELNDAAVGDFLLFGLNCDVATTIFRGIRRLPPAHCLSVSAEGLQLRRYWTAPTNGSIRYRHPDDYVEHFQILFQSAVADRLRVDRAGILLSGGLDSGAVATTAREIANSSLGAADLRAYTVVYESLIPDQDGPHAAQVADFLHIPIRYLAVDGLRAFERWDDPELSWPEPVDDPLFAGLFDQFRMIAADCRVALSGEGGDNLMHFEMWPYAKQMLRKSDYRHLLTQLPLYLRQRSSPWPGIRRRFKGIFGKDYTAPIFPAWLDPEFARRLNLEARWKEWSELPTGRPHPLLPKAHASLSLPHWADMFEHENPGVSRCAVEVRYPFLDLRIVDFLLALPPFPWFFEKKLLREAMIGRLPESARVRPKTPLAGDPLTQKLRSPEAEWLDQVQWNEDMGRYVNHSAISPLRAEKGLEQTRSDVRPLCLNFWLQSARRVRYNLRAEVCNA